MQYCLDALRQWQTSIVQKGFNHGDYQRVQKFGMISGSSKNDVYKRQACEICFCNTKPKGRFLDGNRTGDVGTKLIN